MTRALTTGGALTVAAAAVVSAFVSGMRRKTRPILKVVREISRTMKPLALRTTGTKGAHTSVVRHVGRRSGRQYETPVVAVATPDGFVIALPYGPETDWLKNVVAAGGADVVFDGDIYAVDDPRPVRISDVEAAFGPRERRLHEQFRVRDALRVHTVAVRPAPREAA